jgi:hypothetical protein
MRSARELSEACDRVGFPIARNAIANIESGRKTTISLHEVLVFARALGVPPVRLLIDPADPDPVEVLPGVLAEPWPALQWFTGEGFLRRRGAFDPDPEEAEAGSEHAALSFGRAPLTWLRVHDQKAAEVMAHRINLRSALYQSKANGDSEQATVYDAMAEQALQALARAQRDLAQWRDRMAALGLNPPPIQPDLLPPAAEPSTESPNAAAERLVRDRIRAMHKAGELDDVLARMRAAGMEVTKEPNDE